MGRTWAFVPVRPSIPAPVQFQQGDVITGLNGAFVASDEQRNQIGDLLKRVFARNVDRSQVWQLQQLLDDGYIRVDAVYTFVDRRHISITII